jgi:hypothetical protein
MCRPGTGTSTRRTLRSTVLSTKRWTSDAIPLHRGAAELAVRDGELQRVEGRGRAVGLGASPRVTKP